MENKIRIRCRVCGKVLVAAYQPNLDKCQVTCPSCKTKAPFKVYELLGAPGAAAKPQDDGHTVYGGQRPVAPNTEDHTQYGGGPEPNTSGPKGTPTDPNQCKSMGKLIIPGRSAYRLRLGQNVVGREAMSSKAECQVPTPSRRLSRAQIFIEVKNDGADGFKHYVSLCKENLNETMINDTKLIFGDSVILHDQDVIKLPDVAIKFDASE